MEGPGGKEAFLPDDVPLFATDMTVSLQAVLPRSQFSVAHHLPTVEQTMVS
jgi:hypothetical protein